MIVVVDIKLQLHIFNALLDNTETNDENDYAETGANADGGTKGYRYYGYPGYYPYGYNPYRYVYPANPMVGYWWGRR